MERHAPIDERLAEIELFRGLPTRTLRDVMASATPVELAPGAVITKEGRPGSQFLVLLEGVVAVSACERVVATRGAGDFLGEISLLGARVQSATALATTPVAAAVFSKPDFWSMLGAAPQVGEVLRATMATRLVELATEPQGPAPVM
jgi:CRP-like cAMP-binding protein